MPLNKTSFIYLQEKETWFYLSDSVSLSINCVMIYSEATEI